MKDSLQILINRKRAENELARNLSLDIVKTISGTIQEVTYSFHYYIS